MFWIGFISIHIMVIILLLFSKYIIPLCGKYKNELNELFCTFIFTMLTYIFSLFYTYVIHITSNLLVSAFICAIYLVISWILTVKIYLCIATDNQTLTKNDKNFCHLVSIIGVIFSAIIMGLENSEIGYAILISCSVSILIGAYVPISSIYDNKSIRLICKDIAENFKDIKMTVIIVNLFCLVLIILTSSSNKYATKIQIIIENFGAGVIVGILSIAMSVVLYVKIKNTQ